MESRTKRRQACKSAPPSIILSPELTDSGWSNDSSTASEDVENVSFWRLDSETVPDETKPTTALNGYTLQEAGITERAFRQSVEDTSTMASYTPLLQDMDARTDGVQSQISELKQKLEKTATEVKELGGRVSFLERNKEATSSEFLLVRRTFQAVHTRVNGIEELVLLQGRALGLTSGVSQGAMLPGPQPQGSCPTRPRADCPRCSKNLGKDYVRLHIKKHCPYRQEGMAPPK